MFTRCPECEAIFEISARQFPPASGFVRCGRCRKKFPSLYHLFDHWPEPGEQPAQADDPGIIPILGHGLPAEGVHGGAGQIQSQHPANPKDEFRLQPLWMLVLVLLVLATLANVAMTFQQQLLQQPRIRSAAEYVGLVEPLPEVPFSDLSLIHLVSRDIHPHPTIENALVLSATLINRADLGQAYPVLEVTLFDLHKQPLGQRRFLPAEYLDESSDPAHGLSPGVLLPIILEMDDPGPDAVGFEIRFM